MSARLGAAAALALAFAAPLAAQQATMEALADQFEYALVAGDSRPLPTTEDFRYTENGSTLRPFDGMWRTLSAVAGTDPVGYPRAIDLDYRVQIVDGDQVVRLVEMDENTVRGVMALRLRMKDARIAEAEVLPIREEFAGERAGTITLMQPMLPVTMDGALVGATDAAFLGSLSSPESRAALLAVADSYFDALVANRTAGVGIADDCIRRDNGQRVTDVADAPPLDPAQPAYRPFALGCREQIDSGYYTNLMQVRGRRHFVDTGRGLVLSLVHLDQPGTALSFDAPGVGKVDYPGPRGAQQGAHSGEQFEGRIPQNMITPMSISAAYLFKIENGQIRRIDAFQRGAPYGWQSGW